MTELPNDFSYALVEEGKQINKDTSKPIVEVNNLKFYYNENKEKVILDNFNLSIKEGMFLGIAGPSGCGKSSLIKLYAN